MASAVPTGLGSYFFELTPDLRPGLSYVAPLGLERRLALSLHFAPRDGFYFARSNFVHATRDFLLPSYLGILIRRLVQAIN